MSSSASRGPLRPTLVIEQLEARATTDGASFANFGHGVALDLVIGVAEIAAVDTYVVAPSNSQELPIDVPANNPLPTGSSHATIKNLGATARDATVAISEDAQLVRGESSDGDELSVATPRDRAIALLSASNLCLDSNLTAVLANAFENALFAD